MKNKLKHYLSLVSLPPICAICTKLVQVPSSRPDPAPQPQSSMLHPRRKKANSLTISYTGNASRARDDTCGFCKTDSSAVDFSGDFDAGLPKLRVQTSPQRNGSLRRRFVIGGRSDVRDPQLNRKEENRDLIDKMDAHRRLHSAECGQLIPRIRRHTTDVDVASSDILGSEDSEYVLRTISWPPTDSSMRLGQTNLQKAERRVSPPAVPQHASIEAQPATKPCPSAWSSRTRQLMKEKLAENRLNSSIPNSTLPSMTSSSTLATKTAPTEDLSIPNTQARKVNEGFEVLPAGSLEKEPPVKIFGLRPTTLTARSDHKKPNKLRKRSRSVSTSSVSSCGSENAGDKYSRELEMRQTIC